MLRPSNNISLIFKLESQFNLFLDYWLWMGIVFHQIQVFFESPRWFALHYSADKTSVYSASNCNFQCGFNITCWGSRCCRRNWNCLCWRLHGVCNFNIWSWFGLRRNENAVVWFEFWCNRIDFYNWPYLVGCWTQDAAV